MTTFVDQAILAKVVRKPFNDIEEIIGLCGNICPDENEDRLR